MKSRILVPLCSALIFAGAARSQEPGPPRNDGLPPGGPMAEHLKRHLEELRRDGKGEQAERLQQHAREMWERHRDNPRGEHHEGKHMGPPAGEHGEREGHLAEAARHLHAAGINVSPEQLERLSQKFHGSMDHRWQGSPGHAGPDHGPGFRPPMSNAGPGAPPEIMAMHNEIRALAQQVQELRNRVQNPRGGPQERNAESRREGEHHGDGPHAEHHRDHPPGPEANREHRDGAPHPQFENRPHPPGDHRQDNPPPPRERPRNDAPAPPPTR